MYENRKYIVFPVSELHKIDFSQVHETSAETVRRSVDGTKTFVKWDLHIVNAEPREIIHATTNELRTIQAESTGTPDFISNIVGVEGPYNHQEMIEILNSPEWIIMREKE